MSMYRFLLTPRWLGFAALMLALSATMVSLGFWQLSRYHERSTVNARIDAASHAAPVPLASVLTVGRVPTDRQAWVRVTVTGRYDPGHEVLARDRTVNGSVGFEIVTPLVLDDGSAVLVDRGWLPPGGDGGTVSLPKIPAAPSGPVAVVGRIHLPESRPDAPVREDGATQVRRISPARLASDLPYRLYGGYVLLDSQQPSADPAFTGIPSDHQNSAINAGYTVQWWAFALLTLLGYWWAARREARGPENLDLDAYLDQDLDHFGGATEPPAGEESRAPVSPPVGTGSAG